MSTHTRIRKFNTKDTYPNQSLDNDLCRAVRAGNTVYVRGQIGTDFEGNLVGLGDPAAQAEQAMKTLNSCWKRRAAICHISLKPPPILLTPLPRAGLSGGRQMAQGRVSYFNRAGDFRARSAAMADGN